MRSDLRSSLVLMGWRINVGIWLSKLASLARRSYFLVPSAPKNMNAARLGGYFMWDGRVYVGCGRYDEKTCLGWDVAGMVGIAIGWGEGLACDLIFKAIKNQNSSRLGVNFWLGEAGV